MSEKTRSGDGLVYVIQSVIGGPVKIGWTGKDPRRRLIELQPGSPYELRVIGTGVGSRETEKLCHERLDACRSHGEWFWLYPETEALIRELVGTLPRKLARTGNKAPRCGIEPICDFCGHWKEDSVRGRSGRICEECCRDALAQIDARKDAVVWAVDGRNDSDDLRNSVDNGIRK